MSTEMAKCPAFWTTDDGRCSDDDSGAGRHRCSMADDHTMCRCRCSSTHKRPVNHAKRFEERIGRASITVDEKGVGRVMAGLTDLSGQVSAATVRFRAGKPTVIEIEMPVAAAAARGEIKLDEETAKALEVAGWSGPDAELLRRRDLQEALTVEGTLLREWDDLLMLVRQDHDANWVLGRLVEALGNYAPSEIKWSTVIERIGEMRDEIHELQTKAGEQP